MLCCTVWSGVAAAQSVVTSAVFHRLNPGDFVPYSDGVTFFNSGSDLVGTNAGGSAFAASIHLPAGALLTSIELDGCDTAADGLLVDVKVSQCDAVGQNCQVVADPSVHDNVGCEQVVQDLTSGPTTFVNDSSHQLVALLTTGSSFTAFRGLVVGYKLQMSPAPLTATFTDVPTDYPYFRAIEALAASGITQGCGSGNFCPGQPVTRGELAKFLANALGLHWR